jgi:FkbM family methyltransferase
MISYAQVLEDVILDRALGRISEGFYIDVGGYHPDSDSVTRHFYDLGWNGINIEPGKLYFSEFERLRPRDTNLKIAISDHVGEATFYEMDQISTLEARYADRHKSYLTGQYTVPITTLAKICQEHVHRDIHFLKIDVEGHEAAVLRGADFNLYRPWIIVIEAKEPNRVDISTHEEWEQSLISANYSFVFADPLNRYYIAKEHSDLAHYFIQPIDSYVRAKDIWDRMALEKKIVELQNQLSAVNTAQ